MTKFLVTAVTASGSGETYTWGDTYEVDAPSQADAEANVLNRQPAEGGKPYTRIVRTWEREALKGGGFQWHLRRDGSA